MRSEVCGLLQNFRESKKKILLQDYPSIWEKLKQIEDEVKISLNDETFYNEILTQVSTTTQNNKNIAYIDDLLALVATLKSTEELNEQEIDFSKNLFEKLLIDYNNAKETIKWKFSIPGCGDKKEDASGDFIIFHELLKFMKHHETSCIFLTNDVTKGDWLQMDRNPHNHYLEHAFLKTENIVFIIHAEQTLTNISFENIHKVTKIQSSVTLDDTKPKLESTIINIDKGRGFGFILSNEQNLYFNYSDVTDEGFDNLHKNDIVTFTIGKNSEDKPVAKNVAKVIYTFDNPSNLHDQT